MTPSARSLESRTPTLLVIAVAVGLAVAGWRLFYFQTDDAFIAFRYVSNSLAGRGLVWNPAPFRPVEGYTSFLWVILLREVWRLTGFEPPVASNLLSLVFGLGSLLLCAASVLRLSLPTQVTRGRTALLAVALLGVVTNRTFLTWLSSGLETACFDFLFLWWVFEGLAAGGRDRPRWLVRLSVSAALCALTRPDGLLLVLATVAIAALEQPPGRGWAGLAPLGLVPAHLLWRWMTYGDWVPNTYRAKFTGAWPASGARYLLCFILEYGLWFWALLAAVWLFRSLRRFSWRAANGRSIARWVPPLTVLAHLGYYTFVIGGDIFEYRVYAELIVLVFASGAWLASQLADTPARATALLAGLVLLSYPIPWTHWWLTEVRPQSYKLALAEPIADHFPWPLRPVVGVWDDMQAWLIRHRVCLRHQELRDFVIRGQQFLPTRAEGSRIPWVDRSVMRGTYVGLQGWMLPNVAIIDTLGLNDWVIARHPITAPANQERQMAHERQPPAGYLECFRPNVTRSEKGLLEIHTRDAPLTDEQIRECESRPWDP